MDILHWSRHRCKCTIFYICSDSNAPYIVAIYIREIERSISTYIDVSVQSFSNFLDGMSVPLIMMWHLSLARRVWWLSWHHSLHFCQLHVYFQHVSLHLHFPMKVIEGNMDHQRLLLASSLLKLSLSSFWICHYTKSTWCSPIVNSVIINRLPFVTNDWVFSWSVDTVFDVHICIGTPSYLRTIGECYHQYSEHLTYE